VLGEWRMGKAVRRRYQDRGGYYRLSAAGFSLGGVLMSWQEVQK